MPTPSTTYQAINPSDHSFTHIITHPLSLLSIHHSSIYSPTILPTLLPFYTTQPLLYLATTLTHSPVNSFTFCVTQSFTCRKLPHHSLAHCLHSLAFTQLNPIIHSPVTHTPAITPREHFPRVSRRFKSSCGPARTSFMAIKNLN